ncbi:MAG: hypothetical protein IJZ82_07490 [Lachnospiraceae bacterium]|nr:hypothetical protein [Lachnospiraceae bacterium]
MKRGICCLLVALGWWSIWYPQIALPGEAVQIVDEYGTVQDPAEVLECDSEEIPYELLKLMSEEEVQVRFKLVELIQQYMEKVGNRNGSCG